MRKSRLRVVAMGSLLGLGGLILIGCSENSGDTVVPTRASDASGVVPLEARDFSFVPNQLSADLGGSIEVQFTNSGAAPHSLAFYEDAGHTKPIAAARVDDIQPGKQTILRFASPASAATLYFRCEVHPDRMEGELSVGVAR